MKLAKICTAIWICAVAARLTIVFGFHNIDLFRPEPVKIALSLAKTGSFANPYAIPTGFTAHAAPLYPAFLYAVYYLFGDTRLADIVRVVLSIAVAALSYALLPVVARALGTPVAAGVIAGFTGALLPAHLWPESMGQFETAWVAVFLEMSVILMCALSRRAPSSGLALTAGLWCGAGILLSPNLLPALVVLAAFPLVLRRSWGTVVATAALAILPWIARNYLRLDGLFFVRDNFGLELYLSNNDHALAELEQNDISAFYQHEHPFTNAAIAGEVNERGELVFEHDRMNRALNWIRSNPMRFLFLTLARVRNFWSSTMLRPRPRFLLWTLNFFAAAGMVVLYRTNRRAARILGSILLTYPAAYYLVHNGMRYQHPIFWILLLLAGVLARQSALAILRYGTQPSNSPFRQFLVRHLTWMDENFLPAGKFGERLRP